MEVFQSFPILACLEPKMLKNLKSAYVFGTNGTEAVVESTVGNTYWVRIVDSLESPRDANFTNSSHVLFEDCYDLFLKRGSTIKGVFLYGASSSSKSVVVLTSDGELFSWGSNHYGELGLAGVKNFLEPPQSNCALPTPVVALDGKKASKVANGYGFTVCVLDNGELWAWGTGLPGGSHEPRRVTKSNLDKKVITELACGSTFALVLTKDGQVYGWGTNSEGGVGVAGINNINMKIVEPTRLLFPDGDRRIKAIACGNRHALALSEDGTLFAWGSNSNGQLGNGIIAVSCNTPWKVNLDEDAIGVACSMGSAREPNPDDEESSRRRIKEVTKRIVEIAAHNAENLSLALTQHNEVLAWGSCRGVNFVRPMKTSFKNLDTAFCFFTSKQIMLRPFSVRAAAETDGITADLLHSFDNPENCDLKIMVEGKPIHVHKSILKIRSEYFRTMFASEWKESSEGVVEIKNTPYEVYKAYLRYLYTGDVGANLESMEAIKLATLAKSNLDDGLLTLCVDVVRTGLTVENAVDLWEEAVRVSAKEIEGICFNFLINDLSNAINHGLIERLTKEQTNEFFKAAAKAGAFR